MLTTDGLTGSQYCGVTAIASAPMCVEGGPEAQLYVNAGGLELEVVGSHGSSFAGFENSLALPIPNALGLRRLP